MGVHVRLYVSSLLVYKLVSAFRVPERRRTHTEPSSSD